MRAQKNRACARLEIFLAGLAAAMRTNTHPAPRPLPSQKADPIVRPDPPKATTSTESTPDYFFFFAFLVFFLATFFLAFFLAAIGMRANSFNVPFGSDESFAPQNVNNMRGLQFGMQYVRRFRKSGVLQKVHLTPVL